jgi:putative transposase
VIEDEHLLGGIAEIHERNYCAYGYRWMWITLRRRGGRRGRGSGWCEKPESKAPKAVARPGARPSSIRMPTVAPDLFERDVSAEGPNRLWVGDFTYLRSWEGASFFNFGC